MKLKLIKNEIDMRLLEALKEDNDQYQEVISKYAQIERDLLSKFENSSLVFRYELFDAWYRHFVTFDIYMNESITVDMNDHTDHYQIKQDELIKIIEMMRSGAEFFSSDSFFIENDDYCDGYEYKILLYDSNDYYYFAISNITKYDKNSPNAYKMLLFLRELFAYLKEIGIYFKVEPKNGLILPSLFPKDNQ